MHCNLSISKFKKEEFPRKLFAEIRYTWNIRCLVNETIVPANQSIILLKIDRFLDIMNFALLQLKIQNLHAILCDNLHVQLHANFGTNLCANQRAHLKSNLKTNFAHG